MAIEKCVNEFGVNDVIFEEGRELFAVLDGLVENAKVSGANIARSHGLLEVRDLNKLDD